MKMTKPRQWMRAFLETPSDEPQEAGQKLCLMTYHAVTIPDMYMAVLWNPGGQPIMLKRSTTIGCARESWKLPNK